MQDWIYPEKELGPKHFHAGHPYLFGGFSRTSYLFGRFSCTLPISVWRIFTNVISLWQIFMHVVHICLADFLARRLPLFSGFSCTAPIFVRRFPCTLPICICLVDLFGRFTCSLPISVCDLPPCIRVTLSPVLVYSSKAKHTDFYTTNSPSYYIKITK